MLVGLAAGACVGGLVAALLDWELGPIVGWDVMGCVYAAWTWRIIWRLDAAQTSHLATQEDPGQRTLEGVVLIASVASLVAVANLVVSGGNQKGAAGTAQVCLSVATIVVSWAVVHTVYTLRYARIYYTGPDGGVDFNQEEPPDYSDFGYLALTIGMTFQVSDTNLTSRDMRRTAIRHALLSYVFGTGILATTINLVASLAKG